MPESSDRRGPRHRGTRMPSFRGGALEQKKLAEPEGPAKFEQGGFTSRRRKGPKTLFPGASPGNSFGAYSPRNSRRIEYRAERNIALYADLHQREFGLARLQKPQCYCRGSKDPRQLAAAWISSIGLRQLCATENRGTR